MARGQRLRTGLAGEHHVASELLRREWNAALTFGNTEHTDVLAERGDTRKPITIQVKTKQTRGGWWMPGPADPSSGDIDEWFIFVDLAVDPGAAPDVYIVPRNHVAALGSAQKALYPSSGGKMINVHDIDGYKGAWELLDKPVAKARSRLRDWVSENCTDPKLRRILNRPGRRKAR